MVVRPDGGFWGTVGGGALEWELIRQASAALSTHAAPRLRDWPLGPDLGQCCGGRVTTLVETFSLADRETVAAFAAMEAERAVRDGVAPGLGREGSKAAAGC